MTGKGAIALVVVAGLIGIVIGRWSAPGAASATGLKAHTAVPAQFVGSWETHGGSLIIGTSGNGTDHLRAYVNCTNTIMTACDKLIKNGIYPGQFDTFHITKVQGTTAIAGVTDSSYSWRVGLRIKLTLGSNDVLQIHMPDGVFRYCGPKAPAGACGA